MIISDNIFTRLKYYKNKMNSMSKLFHRKEYQEIVEAYEKDKSILEENSKFASDTLAIFIAEVLTTSNSVYYVFSHPNKYNIITTKNGYEKIDELEDRSIEEIIKTLGEEDYIIIDKDGYENPNVNIINKDLNIKESFTKNHPELKDELQLLINTRINLRHDHFNRYLANVEEEYYRRTNPSIIMSIGDQAFFEELAKQMDPPYSSPRTEGKSIFKSDPSMNLLETDIQRDLVNIANNFIDGMEGKKRK